VSEGQAGAAIEAAAAAAASHPFFGRELAGHEAVHALNRVQWQARYIRGGGVGGQWCVPVALG
jgi:hypothetical protein